MTTMMLWIQDNNTYTIFAIECSSQYTHTHKDMYVYKGTPIKNFHQE